MNKKDVSMIKKAFGNEESSPFVNIASCYVDVFQEDVRVQPTITFSRIEEDKAEQYVTFFKKAVSGKPGVTLMELKPEKNELKAALDSKLEDEEAVSELFRSIKDSYKPEENYGIFAAYGIFDIVSSKSEEGGLYDGDDDEVYEYLLVTILPCALNKPGIIYDFPNNDYTDSARHRQLTTPVHTFLYPSFDEGHADTTHVAYISKNTAVQSEADETMTELFGVSIPIPAAQQKAAFEEMMMSGSNGSVSYEALQNVYGRLAEIKAEALASNEEATLTTKELKDIIKSGGDLSEEDEKLLDEVSDTYENKHFSVDNITSKNVSVNVDRAVLKIDLNDFPDLEVIVHNGQKCILIPISGAEVDDIKVNTK